MARRTVSAEPQMANLSAEQMRRGITRLENAITDIETFDPMTVQKRFGPEEEALQMSIDGTLSSVFGHKTVEYNRYHHAARLDNGPLHMESDWINARDGYGSRNGASEAHQYLAEGKIRSVHILRQAIKWLSEELANKAEYSRSTPDEPADVLPLPQTAFIVHGHDSGPREAVARFLEKINIKPIILHEQANKGKTIIEKVETHGNVGFAIILLTPDDEGNKVGSEPRFRPRQNVLLELGYFIGRLGRAKVCALSTDDTMELPTDFAGVVWEKFDNSGGWKQSLARELKAAGLQVDWNKVME